MSVVWSRLARQHLVQITSFIRRDNPRAAAAIRRRITQATRRLVDHPASGRPGRWRDTRELVIPGTPYILPYTVVGDQVRIIAVLHAARKWPDDAAPRGA